MADGTGVWFELFKWLLSLTQVAIIAGIGWVIRGSRQHSAALEKIEERLGRVERGLFGEDGTNGIRSRVEKLERSRHGLRNVLQDLWLILTGHDDELREHHEQLTPDRERRSDLPGRRVTDLAGWRDA